MERWVIRLGIRCVHIGSVWLTGVSSTLRDQNKEGQFAWRIAIGEDL